MSKYYNDGTGEPPKLAVYLNMENLDELPAFSIWSGLEGIEAFHKLKEDGFEGVQLTNDDPVPDGMPFPWTGLDRINKPEDADLVAAKHADRGDRAISVHVGWGMEDDDEIAQLIEAVEAASDRHQLPIFIETHRATITQDIWRTVQMVKKFPDVRINADFSHYYCGQEMQYGGVEMKLSFMQPILDRTGFMHGRIASPGCMQMPVESADARPLQAHGGRDYLADFKQMWTLAMQGFRKNAQPGDVLPFAPELLKPQIYYARMFAAEGQPFREESDRYEQALLYKTIAKNCWNKTGL